MEPAQQATARVQLNDSRLTEDLVQMFQPSDPTDEAALTRAGKNRDWSGYFFD